MQSILETVLIFILRQILTPELIKQGEVALVAYLKNLASDTANKVDDFMVEAVAEALNVPYSK